MLELSGLHGESRSVPAVKSRPCTSPSAGASFKAVGRPPGFGLILCNVLSQSDGIFIKSIQLKDVVPCNSDPPDFSILLVVPRRAATGSGKVGLTFSTPLSRTCRRMSTAR